MNKEGGEVGMTDREKIIIGLEHCTNCAFDCFDMDGCPYDNGTGNDRLCMNNLMRDALALLKAQGPVKPILKREGWNVFYNYYVCPVCKQELVY